MVPARSAPTRGDLTRPGCSYRGIGRAGGTVTLEGPDPSPIVVDNCVVNCVGGVAKCAAGGACPP